jgi:hypothetical protein
MILRLFITVCLFGFLGFNAQAQSDKNYLRVGVYDLSADNHIILIGIDQTIKMNPTANTLNAQGAGFRSVDGKDIQHLDPKFLLTMTRNGIQLIYTFDLGKVKTKDGTPVANMPSVLLDLQKMKKQLIEHSAPELGIEVVRLLLGNTFVHGGQVLTAPFFNRGEGGRQFQAKYLEGIIAEALDTEDFPALRNAINSKDWLLALEDLGAALTIRFHLESIPKGVVQTQASRILYYRTLRANHLDHSSRQFDQINMLATRACLTTTTLTPYLGAIFINRKTYDDCIQGKAPYDKHRMGLDHPEKTISEFSDIPGDAGDLIFQGIYILDGQDMFVQLVDFEKPDKLKQSGLMSTLHMIAVTTGIVLQPLEFSILIRMADDELQFIIDRKGSTLFKSRLEGYAEMMMIMETGLATVNIDGLVKEALMRQAQKAGAPNDLLAQYKAGLNSGDKEKVERTIEDMMTFFEYREKGKIWESSSEKNIVKANKSRADHWAAFTEWMKDPSHLAGLNTDLDQRAIKNDEREKQILAKHPEWIDNGLYASPDALASTTSSVAQPPLASNIAAQETQTRALASSAELLKISEPAFKRPSASLERPVIVLMVDGLRPDRIKIASDRGYLPNIKENFLEKGVQLNSYSTYTVSIPAWGTILSGQEPATTGVRGSSTASRDPDPKKKWQSLLDWRPDTHGYVVGHRTRVYKRFLQTKVKPAQDYLGEKEVLVGTSPIADIGALPVGEALKQVFRQYPRVAFKTFSINAAIDLSTGIQAAKDIRKSPGQYKMVYAWFGAVDHSSHSDNHSIFDSYKAVDAGIGEILKAASEDPVLKNAELVLLSDHGEMGGEELADPTRRYMPEGHFLDNSTFNLLMYFTGDMPGSSEKYNFVASSHKASEPLLDAGPYGSVLNTIWVPYYYTYKGVRKNQGRPGFRNNTTIMTEPYGDAVDYVFFLEDAKRDPAKRLSYYDLTHYTRTRGNVMANIPEDLLAYSLPNVDFSDYVKKEIKKINDNRPVGIIAIPLQGDNAVKSALAITGGGSKVPTRDPVVVRAFGGKTAIILTHDDPNGQVTFRYTVLSDFKQAQDGTVSGKISDSPTDDPFGYLALGLEWNQSDWKTDRQWLKLAELTDFPTGVMGIPYQLTLAPPNQGLKDLTAETPDMILFSSLGFSFNSFQMHQGDHGGLTPSQVRTCFFVSDKNMAPGLVQVNTPILTRDAAPTILDYLGKGSEIGNLAGKSMKSIIEKAAGSEDKSVSGD